MKKFLFVCITLLSLLGCRTTPINQTELIKRLETERHIDKIDLMKKFNTIDIISSNDAVIIINNPYKNKGLLNLKGAIHNHTDNSLAIDGYMSGDPYETAVKFRDKGGFDFYTFTDHNYITNDPGVPGIIWLGNAVEDTKDTQHLIAYNLPADYKYVDMGIDIQVLIDYYKNLDAIVSYCHPDWSRQIQSDNKIISVTNLDFVEVVNDSEGSGSERAFDLLLSKGLTTFGLGVDDYHYNSKWEEPDRYFNKGYIIAFAEKKAKTSIWKALLSGCFYAVTGNVRIDISCKRGVIKVSSKELSTFEFIGLNTENPGTGKILYTLANAKKASYSINGEEGYVRGRVTNSSGTAYTQPFVILSNN